MQLNRIDDPRDPLMKLSRKECEYIARWKGITEIKPGMPKPLMVGILKKHQIFRMPSVAVPPLGSHRPNVTPPYEEWLAMVTGERPVRKEPEAVIEVTPEQLLEASWNASQAQEPKPTLEDKKRTELMQMAKAAGVKVSIQDKKADLIRKLTHGEDAP